MCWVSNVTMWSQVGHPAGVSHPQPGLEQVNGVGGGILIEGITGLAVDNLSKEQFGDHFRIA